jgi:adenine-specific DNA-methyltransferase
LNQVITNEELNNRITLINDDISNAIKKIEDESASLLLTSPPYNLKKEYEKDSPICLEQYIQWIEPIVDNLCKKVSLNGSICWQTGNHIFDGEIFPLDYYFYSIFKKNGFKLRNRIVWHFKFGLNATKRLSGRYETILWFTRSDQYTFNLDPIRIPQMYPGKRHSSKKGKDKAGKPSGNPLGKNPSDYWTFSAEDLFHERAVWELPNVKANHPELTTHPCQFPNELAERCILAFTNPGDLVFDPFAGAGTTVIAALGANRRALAVDRSAEYIALTHNRVRLFLDGNLPLRRSGSDIYEPRSTDRVAQIPSEWKEAAE